MIKTNCWGRASDLQAGQNVAQNGLVALQQNGSSKNKQKKISFLHKRYKQITTDEDGIHIVTLAKGSDYFSPLCSFIAPSPPSRTTHHIARLPLTQTTRLHPNQLVSTVPDLNPRPLWDVVEEKNQAEKSAASTKNSQKWHFPLQFKRTQDPTLAITDKVCYTCRDKHTMYNSCQNAQKS